MNITEARVHVEAFKQSVESAKPHVAELNDLLTMYVALVRRSGISPELTTLIAKAQQGRIAIETLTRSIQLFYATSGPLGWAILAGGILLSGFMVADMMEIRRPQY